MKITILGSGSSGGVPLIGNDWGKCDPNEPKNHRFRASILVEEGDTALLIDTTPEMREQLLAANVKNITAVLYTHPHADHAHGIDDLRTVNWMTGKPVSIYAAPEAMAELRVRFPYIFSEKRTRESIATGYYGMPTLLPHEIEGTLQFGSIKVTPFIQQHGRINSLGFRFNDFAYSTDVVTLDENAFKILEGVKVWIVDAARETPHPNHSHLSNTLAWMERVKPERGYITHMDESMDYATISAKLPPNVFMCYDGLVIE